MNEFITQARVYIEDTDFGGVVYHANYLCWMERARTELLRSAGFEQQTLIDEDLLFVIRAVEIRYRAPAKLDDKIIIKTSISKQTFATMVFSQRIYLEAEPNNEGPLLCEASVEVASVSVASRQVIAVPKHIASAMKAYS
ncbi:MAG: YbgC/FadM family acyl-CoA thioesterase [Pseudomonadales bacterium]|nr:YbgC/FadM family acyl-CoA thioesterase [Pseudomonadales bacterium]